MALSHRAEILADPQIRKFSCYGFLKNLQFFEPYLLIFLLGHGLTLLEIGFLLSIREVIINLFEIPSGVIADYFGRKKELCLCFVFYIISFVCFFFTASFWMAALAMVFYGLGEAFRSGTHKAMIYTYLEHRGWQSEKTFVYGKTRSASLVGSAVSALFGIGLILTVPNVGYIFLLSTIPYILDFFLILSYPNHLDRGDVTKKETFGDMMRSIKHSLRHNRSLQKILLSEGIFESITSSVKHFIQPIMQGIVLGSGIIFITTLSADDNLNVILGIVYAVINLIGAVASRKSYLLRQKKSGVFCLNALHIGLVLALFLLGIFMNQPIMVCLVYMLIYSLNSLRKPIFVEEIDCYIAKTNRALTLSISSQLKSLFIIVLAPLTGYVADTFGIQMVMYLLSALLVVTLPLLFLKENDSFCRID